MLDFTQLQTLQVPIETIVKMVFYFVMGAYAIFSSILYYHWNAYGTNVGVTLYTFVVYFFTTIPLFVVMGIMAFNI